MAVWPCPYSKSSLPLARHQSHVVTSSWSTARHYVDKKVWLVAPQRCCHLRCSTLTFPLHTSSHAVCSLALRSLCSRASHSSCSLHSACSRASCASCTSHSCALCSSCLHHSCSLCCRQGEMPSHTQTTQLILAYSWYWTEERQDKTWGRPLVSGSAGNWYSSNFSNKATSQSKKNPNPSKPNLIMNPFLFS